MRHRSVMAAALLCLVLVAAGCIQQEMDLTDEAQLVDRASAATSTASAPTVTAAATNTASPTPTATSTASPSATYTVTPSPTATAESTMTPTPSPSATAAPTLTPTNTETPARQPTPVPTQTPTATPPPVVGSSAVPIAYFDNNPDWDTLVACVANFGSEITISPDGFHNVAGPFDRYEDGIVYFQGTGESNALNAKSVAGIRYVTQGDPLFRFEPPHFGQLPWTAETVIGALQPGDWIIVGGQSGYLGVACNAYQP